MGILKFLFRKFFIMEELYRPIIPFKINLLHAYARKSFKKDGVSCYNIGDYLSKAVFAPI